MIENGLNLILIVPELFLAVAGMVLLIAGVLRGNTITTFLSWSTVFCFAITAALILGLEWDRGTALFDMLIIDGFSSVMKLVILTGLAAALTISISSLSQDHILRFEYPILMLFAGLGMLLMVSANDLLAVYVGLELQSLALYVLAAIRRSSVKSAEAGMKYFVLGALSSGMLLFGMSLIYGFAGSISFPVLAETLSADSVPLGITFGMVFLLAGLAFKVSAVPFHMWTPDVYEGAPTPVTAFFAIVPKIAAIALLMRILFQVFPEVSDQWIQIIWFLSLASMTVGAFAALVQDNIKRLMAYSSIGNLGYAMIGLAAASPEGNAAVIVYMTIYMVMTAGTFAIILCMRRDGYALEKISDLSGLSKNSPILAYALAILMFSMAGIPPMAGFFGKLIVFKAAVASELYILAVLGVLTSVVAAYYYLRIIKVMFFDDPTERFDSDIPFERRAVIFIAILFVMLFMIYPSPLIESAAGAASSLILQ